jgi:ribosomal protein S18 acetylase RimI-like enzyme
MKDEGATIRQAGAGDYNKCLPLLTLLYHGDVGPGFRPCFEDYVKSENGVVLISEKSNLVMGVLVGSHCLDIDWEGKTARIDALIVNEKYRRTGIASKLVNRFAELSRQMNCKAIKSRVNAKNRGAQAFHERLGFKRADTHEYFLDLETQR